MIEYKNAESCDKESLKNLWHECFGDEYDYINLYFDNMYQEQYCYVAKEDDKIASMMMFLPATMVKGNEKINGRYVYAVATKPEFRGKGIMRKLEEFASEDVKAKGVDFLTLVPASQSLFNLYSQIGYEVYANLESVEYNKLHFNEHTTNTKITQVPINELDSLRENFLQSFDEYIYINDKDYIKKELSFLGAMLCTVENNNGKGYILYFKNEQKLYVKECALNDKLLKSSLENICKILECENIVLKLSQKSLKSINKTPYSMVKWLKQNEIQGFKYKYQNLMLD